MLTVTNLLGAFLVVQVPEGGAAWAYLILASAACVGAYVFHSRSRLGGRGND